MSRLNDLITELCPGGVPYKKITSVAKVARGKRVVRDQLPTDGKYLVYQNSLTPLGRINETNFKGDITFIIGAGAAGEIGYSAEKFWAADDCFPIVCDRCVSDRYLYHVLLSKKTYLLSQVRRGSIPRLSRNVIEDLVIPVPPLEVQREIVQILDKFTKLTAELQAELQAELSARRKQYEYYKDVLLPFDADGIKWRTLGEISTIVRGASPRPIKNFITEDKNGVNWIKIGDVSPEEKYVTQCAEMITPEGAKKSRIVKPGDFILSNSMSFGRPYILQIEGCIHDGWLAISNFDQYVSPDYLYHILTSSHIQKEMKQKASFGGAVQNLNADIVRGIRIPIPSKEEQSRIVSILDRFSLLCNNISSKLPAEIESRRLQYEYYRDKLLTFKEL